MDLSFSPSSSEISELKSSMRNMDKYKYVLNHKIHLLQEEIQPKVCANVLKGDIFYINLFNTALSAALQIQLCRRMMGLIRGLLRL